MRLGIVIRRNPYFPPNTWVEISEEGIQRVEIQKEGHGIRYKRAVGLVYPVDMVAEFIQPILTGSDGKRF